MLFTMPAAEAPDVVVDGVGVGVGVGVDAPAGSFVAWVLELPPGPQSLALLCSLDADTLTPAERLLVLQAWERQHAWMSAQVQAATAAAAGPEPVTPDDWARDEVAAALRLSTGGVSDLLCKGVGLIVEPGASRRGRRDDDQRH